jgi:uncharacterized protein YegJ (DUF2314 family)
MKRFPFLIAASLVIATPMSAPAQTPLERAEKDDIFYASDDDPAMIRARKKARETFAEFLALAEKPRETTRNFAVKVGVREGRQTEFFWIAPFARKGEGFSGNLNNTPRLVKRVKSGEEISFARNEIIDWMYIEDGQMKGNFTACALILKSPPQDQEAFKKRFGFDCNF